MSSKWRSGRGVDAVADNIETLTGQRGDGSQRAVTYEDLASLGLANLRMLGGKAKLTPGTSDSGESSNSKVQTPTRPTGFKATGGFAYILLEWDMPQYSGRSLTEIYRYPEDNIANAVLIATTAAGVYGDPVDPATGYYYWIRHVNILGKPGPYNDSTGTYAETHADPTAIVEMVQEQLNQSPLIEQLTGRIGANEQNITEIIQNAEVMDERIDSVNAVAGSASAGVSELKQSVAADKAAMSQRVDTVEATANAAATKASVDSLSQSVATQNSAMGQRVDTVEATANSAEAAAQTNTQAIATLDGVKAMWTAKTQAGQISAGIGIVASVDSGGNTVSQVAVAANQFFIFDPNNPNDNNTYAIPFAVVDGKVVLDQLIAQDAVVKILAAQTITADTVKVGATLTAVNIKTSTIESGGFTVDELGNATFGQLVKISASGQISIKSNTNSVGLNITNNEIILKDENNINRIEIGL